MRTAGDVVVVVEPAALASHLRVVGILWCMSEVAFRSALEPVLVTEAILGFLEALAIARAILPWCACSIGLVGWLVGLSMGASFHGLVAAVGWRSSRQRLGRHRLHASALGPWQQVSAFTRPQRRSGWRSMLLWGRRAPLRA